MIVQRLQCLGKKTKEKSLNGIHHFARSFFWKAGTKAAELKLSFYEECNSDYTKGLGGWEIHFLSDAILSVAPGNFPFEKLQSR